MSFSHLPIVYKNLLFHLSSISGSLRAVPAPSDNRKCWPECGPSETRLSSGLRLCNEPYRISPAKKRADAVVTHAPVNPSAIAMADRMIRLCSKQFFLARAYASMRRPIFNSASEAVTFFRENTKGDQSKLCLSRALFAAKTSRQFTDAGVVIIGVALPARALHAWVIEDGSLADSCDDIWINYRPVAAIA